MEDNFFLDIFGEGTTARTTGLLSSTGDELLRDILPGNGDVGSSIELHMQDTSLLPMDFDLLLSEAIGSDVIVDNTDILSHDLAPQTGQTGAIAPLDVRVANNGEVMNVLDLDGNGVAEASSDGIMAARLASGLRGEPVTLGAVAEDATRTDPEEIQAFYEGVSPFLDVDGNGVVGTFSDIVMILRVLTEVRGDAVTSGAVAADATRTDPADIEAYIESLVDGTVITPEPETMPVVEVSPANGEDMVNLTRETVVRFGEKVDPATVNDESFFLIANGEEVAGRIDVSSTEEFATFFYDEPLPGATEVRVVVNGDGIFGRDGDAIDADGDGNPGGTLTADFRTLPLTRIEGTDVFGFVFDSFNSNADGSNIPIVGATIRVDAFPEANAVTDENGFFRLEDLPAPEFSVHIDGSTASNAPDGTVYATVGKLFESVPGQETQLTMDGETFDIFLPPLATDDIQELSPTEDTNVGFGEAGTAQLEALFPDVDASLWELTQVTFPAGSAQDEEGNAATQATIIPVDPERLPAPLPPNIDPQLVISIQAGGDAGFSQAGGATNFDVPAPVTFPNLEGLAPGEQSLIWSFNHDSGDWEVVGTGTVSADGRSIVSDEGVGILAPGWHFTNPGSETEGPEDPPCLSTGDIIETVIDAGTAAANCAKDFFAISETIDRIFTIASEIRSVVNAAQNILNDIENDTLGTASGVANALAGINASKRALVNAVDAFRQQDPISRALKISRCIGQAIGFAENLCNRLNQPDSPCSGLIVRTVCVGLGAASSTLDKVNNLIQRADDGLNRLALEAVCGIIDQIASTLGPASQQNSVASASLFPGFALSANEDDLIPPEVITLLQELVTQGDATATEFEPVEELGTSIQELEQEADNLQNGLAQIRAEFETAPANAPYLVEYNGFEFRGKTDNAGKIEVVLPGSTDYTITIYDPATNSLGEVSGTTAPTGSNTQIPTFLMIPITNEIDTDGEGLVDRAEQVIGTVLNNIDTDSDGINDLAEIQQGLDPLGGRAFPTGIISSLPLQGEAKKVVVEGSSLDAQGQTAYVATGSHGLAIVDASQFDNPIVLGQLELPGDATDVAVDANLQIAAVATGDGGLQLVDVSDPMLPTTSSTLNISANQVEVADGIAYATVGSGLRAIDLLTGDELDSITLSSFGTVTDLAREGTNLYAFTSGPDTFSVIDIADEQALNVLGQVNVNIASSQVGVFAANGIAYLAGSGLRTIDVSNPSNPSLVGNAEQFFTAREVTLNGSGLGLVAAENQGLGIYDVTDPQDTDAFVTQIDTPGFASDVAIASGIAFVADDRGGLQVINYLPFDNQGEAPTEVTVNTSVTDADPDTPGIQVVEGTSIPITAAVVDDVQVRNVELLFNGEVVANDVSFPFDISGIAPNITPEFSTLDIQLRATDTGGNSTLSNVVTLDLIEDTFPPEIVRTSPDANGFGLDVSAIVIRFNENLNTSLPNLSEMTLTNLGADGEIGGGDDFPVALGSVETPTDRKLVIFTENTLEEGSYQLVIDPSIIADRAGNILESDTGEYVLRFNSEENFSGGNPIFDAISEPGEQDQFIFRAKAETQLYFLPGENFNFNLNVELIDPLGFNGSRLSSGPVTLSETGTYLLEITSFGDRTEEYSFNLFATNEAPEIILDTRIEPSLEPGLSANFFKLEGTANQRLLFDSISVSETSVADWFLYDPNNRLVRSTSLENDFAVTLVTDGTYLLVINDNNTNAPIDYSFQVVNSETTTTALTFGETVTGTLAEIGDRSEYTFVGTEGQQLLFDSLSEEESFTEGIWTLLGPEDRFIGSANLGFDFVETLPTDGEYVLVLEKDRTGGPIDYSFQVVTPERTTTDLSFAQTITGTLNRLGDRSEYTFIGMEGQQLLFDSLLEEESFTEGIWTLLGPEDRFIGSANLSSDFAETLPTDGEYVLVLEKNRTGDPIDYSFQVVTPETTTTNLAFSETITGSIDQVGDRNEFTFTGTEGQQLYYDALSDFNSLDIQLEAPDGSQVFGFRDADSDSGPVTLTLDGTYRLKIGGNSTGDYSFRLLNMAEAPVLTLDRTFTDSLDLGNETDFYRFEGTASQRLRFENLSESEIFAINWLLYEPNNRFISSNRFSSDFIATLPSDGDYLLGIQGFNAEAPVNYSFQVVTPETTTTALTFAETITGTLDRLGDRSSFTFEGTADRQLAFDSLSETSETFAGEWTLFGPNNQSIRSNDLSADLVATLPTDGEYVLVLENNNSTNEPIDYSFQVVTPQTTTTAINLDEEITGEIDRPGAIQEFTFSGTVGQRLFFDDLGIAGGNWTLFGPNDQLIISRRFVSDFEVTLPSDGNYRLVLDNNDRGTSLVYNFQIVTPETTTTDLSLRDS